MVQAKDLHLFWRRRYKYYDKTGAIIDKKHWLYPYKELLCNTSRAFLIKHSNNITAGCGVYGIFVRKPDNSLGKCLYIGQSVNVKNRVAQHKKCFKTAQRHLIGCRVHNKKLTVKKLNNYKVELKYYKMADKYKLSELKFRKIIAINTKKLTEQQIKELLTYAEQHAIEVFKPQFNTFAARPTTQ